MSIVFLETLLQIVAPPSSDQKAHLWKMKYNTAYQNYQIAQTAHTSASDPREFIFNHIQ